MKKLFALILALMMALTCMTAAGAEAPAAEAPAADAAAQVSAGTISIGLDVAADTVAQLTGATDESAAGMINAIVGLVNKLGITVSSDGVDAEMFLKIDEKPVFGVAVLKDTDKMFILSDLFPNTILRVDEQTMGGMTGGTMPSLNLDPEQLSGLMEPINKLTAEMMSKIGVPEATETTIADTVFTVKNPINLTTKEALGIVLGVAKEIVSQEGFASLLEQAKGMGLPLDFSAAEIDKKIEELGSRKDEELPVLDAALYSNADEDGVFVVKLNQDDQAITVTTGSIKGSALTEVDVPDKMHFLMQTLDNTLGANLQVVVQEGLKIEASLAVASGDEGFVGALEIEVNDAELGSITVTGEPGATLSGEFTIEGKKEIAIQDAFDTTKEDGQAFSTDMQSGLILLMTKVMQVYPDFATIMQSLMPQTSAPAAN